jgi:hypothetical protein
MIHGVPYEAPPTTNQKITKMNFRAFTFNLMVSYLHLLKCVLAAMLLGKHYGLLSQIRKLRLRGAKALIG